MESSEVLKEIEIRQTRIEQGRAVMATIGDYLLDGIELGISKELVSRLLLLTYITDKVFLDLQSDFWALEKNSLANLINLPIPGQETFDISKMRNKAS